MLACCNPDFPVISACLIADKLTRCHVQTSSNLMVFHNIRIILSRSFFSGFKTTRYVFPMSIRIIKWFKIFLSPPPQNAHESTRIQFSLLISASKLGTQYVHVRRRHIIWFSLDLSISPDSLDKLFIAISPYIIGNAKETVRWCKFLSNAVKAPDTKLFQ